MTTPTAYGPRSPQRSLWRRFRHRLHQVVLLLSLAFVLVPFFGRIPQARIMMARGALLGFAIMSPVIIMTILAILVNFLGLI